MTFAVTFHEDVNLCIRNFATECGRFDRNVKANIYWNNIDAGLNHYHAFLNKGIVYFDTEQDYMFFKLKYG